MFYKPLLIPLLIQVALTFAVLFTMFGRRVSEFKRKRVHPQKTHQKTFAIESPTKLVAK